MTNFVFSRRAVQQAINRLATVLDADQLRLMVERLNRAGETRLPTMWEIVLLDAFAGVGRLRHEVELPNGRRETNMARRKGHYFFSDIRKEGVVLYELDDEPSPSRGRAVFRKPTRRRRSSSRSGYLSPRTTWLASTLTVPRDFTDMLRLSCTKRSSMPMERCC